MRTGVAAMPCRGIGKAGVVSHTQDLQMGVTCQLNTMTMQLQDHVLVKHAGTICIILLQYPPCLSRKMCKCNKFTGTLSHSANQCAQSHKLYVCEKRGRSSYRDAACHTDDELSSVRKHDIEPCWAQHSQLNTETQHVHLPC